VLFERLLKPYAIDPFATGAIANPCELLGVLIRFAWAWDDGAMQIGILGSLQVHNGTVAVEIAGSRLRALTIRLALDAGRAVSATALVDAIWGEQPPADEANALQSLVSRLRRALGGANTIAQSPAGYVLAVSPNDVDANVFRQLAQRGRAALRDRDGAGAARLLREALALWRGPALADVADLEFSTAPATQLHDLRLSALADRIEAELSLGNAPEIVAEAGSLVEDHPLDERLSGLLMTALYQAGRQADALGEYDRIRERLSFDLGIDPSPDLQSTQLAILRADPALATPITSEPPAVRRRTNVRAQLTSFVGRDDEVNRISKLLGECRLVTIVGPGGAGKTRLANQVGANLIESFEDGIWLVELAPVTDGSDVPAAVLGSLGLRESRLLERPAKITMRDAISQLTAGLDGKCALLVFDNCEHLIDACAQLADQLLADCADLRILATSREPLGIFGEVLTAAPPLGQPAPGTDARAAMEFPAVRLFADRAAAVRPDFTVDATTVEPIISIVRGLDGLPLAIELAAARLRTLPVHEVAARLSDRFRLLTGGSRTALPRHRTLRAVVDWSWDLLGDHERLLVERLAVFPAGASPASAEAICAHGELGPDEVLELLSSLADKSLLQETSGPGEPVRYRLLETIREYGLERLAERNELSHLRAVHAEYFRAMVLEAEPHLRRRTQLAWISKLTIERDNILSALRFFSESGHAQEALEMATSIGWYWMVLGRDTEASTWVSYALAAEGDADPELRLIAETLRSITLATMNEPGREAGDAQTAISRLGELSVALDEVDAIRYPLIALLRAVLAIFANDDAKLTELMDEALTHPDPWVVAAVRGFRANLAENRGDVVTMRAEAQASLAAFREIGERWGAANALQSLAGLHTLDGELELAVAEYTEAVELITELGGGEDEIVIRLRLADVRARQGQLDVARQEVDAAMAVSERSGSMVESVFISLVMASISRQVGDIQQARQMRDTTLERIQRMPRNHPLHGHGLAIALAIAANLDLDEGNTDRALEHLINGYDAAVLTHDGPVIAGVGSAVAAYLECLGRPDDAAQLLGAAALLRGGEDPTQIDIKRLTATLRAQLGDEEFAATYASGRALDREAAMARLDPRRQVAVPET
jgi:predicted ATPase/DNA-binding SARP family transcriptional activator